MKKILFAFAMLAASLMTVVSCEEVVDTAEISFPDAESQELFNSGISFSATPAEGSLTATVSFTSTLDWTVSVEDANETKAPAWLTASPASGSAGPAVVTITAQENESEDARSAQVTIHCGDVSQSVTVTQAGKESDTPTFTVKLDKTEVEMTVGEVLQLIAEITPPDPVARQISWSSSDTQVATVTTGDVVDVTGVPIPGGIVTAVGVGEAIITAKAGDSEATCKVTVVDGTVAVTEISLEEEIHMSPGQTVRLVATVKPEEAAGKVNISWSSSHTEVATVDQEGNVTAVALGETIITAAAGDKSATCLVKVEREVAIVGITLNETSLTLKEGETFQLVATLQPENATPKTIEWFSTIPAVATVDENGLVTAVRKGGPATIWAVIGRGTGYEINAKCEVTVTSDGPSVESITVDPGTATIYVGEETVLTATVTPDGTGAVIQWNSDNTSLAKVEKISDTQAKVTGVGVGHVKVIASVGDKFDYCEVTVEKKSSGTDVESVTLDKTQLEMNIGETAQLTATVLPENATDKTVTWSSSNSRVASVSNGLVVAQSAGETVITAQAGSVSATCTVVVRSSGGGGSTTVESASVDPSSVTIQLDEEKVLTLVTVPADAEVTIYWESANQYIANVQMISKMQAKVKGISVGETTVTVHAGDKTATCQVKVEDASGTNIPVESVTLNEHELSMNVNTQFQLVATVLPENATNKEVVWSSNVQSSKLYIDVNGMLTALQACEATITVRCKANAYIYDTCHVVVTGSSSGGSDEEVVDLGLPSGLKWRSMNVGASKPEDYGNYYAWGETTTKSSYSWSNYKYSSSDIYGDGVGKSGKKVLIPEDDAATANLGNGWRTPKNSEWKELINNCTWKWTTRNGVNGMLLTGPNGKSIFLPAAGYYRPNLTDRGYYGSYWSSSYGSDENALGWDFINTDFSAAYLVRSQGCSVRPVKD